MPPGMYMPTATIYFTIYTLDMNILSELVEEACARYVEINRPNVVIHLINTPHFRPSMTWNNVKHKVRCLLSSIILQEGVVDALVRDAQEFINTEDWYVEAGIPHRRGYLLYGPPGTRKVPSTIYALAGALNLEIYLLSLASGFVDDSFLQCAMSAILKHTLFLIEDIDCVFARDDEDEDGRRASGMMMQGRAEGMMKPAGSKVMLSGLLKAIDGVGSEEGKLFFATTNYIDRLDPTLLCPGHIDRKVTYGLATAEQGCTFFLGFFLPERFPNVMEPPSAPVDSEADGDVKISTADATDREATGNVEDRKISGGETKPTPAARETISALAVRFAAHVLPAEFSTAELQCYLQGFKTRPAEAVVDAATWVAEQRAERMAREVREAERKQRAREWRCFVEPPLIFAASRVT
ncbi:P-loop containing nucleoside triphosphate hydrolase protein [Mycena sp. CBHHK59/15]|nr:P-loop containing nucleoside triphosphate hydrolase protein [Mycena sp. CBHHK59/15]